MALKKYKNFKSQESEFVEVTIGENHFKCEICSSNEDGLIGRAIEEDGMIFKFPQPMPLVFHTRGCIESIDIVFVNMGKIVKIFNECPPDSPNDFKCFQGDCVLEFPAGTCERTPIVIGDSVNF